MDMAGFAAEPLFDLTWPFSDDPEAYPRPSIPTCRRAC